MELRLPFESPEAQVLNRQIFETIYHAAVEASLEMAMELGRYSSFTGSPASEGKLQFDLWDHKPDFFDDWDELKRKNQITGAQKLAFSCAYADSIHLADPWIQRVFRALYF